jgi:hypothetical protein
VTLAYPTLCARMDRLLFAITPSLPHRCETCGRRCSHGIHAPGRWLGGCGARYHEPGAWECEACSSATWAAYLARRRERMALIEASRVRGYPVTRAQLESGVQLELFGGGE